MENYAIRRTALNPVCRTAILPRRRVRRSALSLLAGLLLSEKAFRVYKAAAVCFVIVLLLGVIGGMESGSVPLWVGVPLCLAGLGSAVWKLY